MNPDQNQQPAHPQTGEVALAIKCLREVMAWHRDPHSPDYNQCDKPGEECAWCGSAAEAIEQLQGQPQGEVAYVPLVAGERISKDAVRPHAGQPRNRPENRNALLAMNPSFLHRRAGSPDAARKQKEKAIPPGFRGPNEKTPEFRKLSPGCYQRTRILPLE